MSATSTSNRPLRERVCTDAVGAEIVSEGHCAAVVAAEVIRPTLSLDVVEATIVPQFESTRSAWQPRSWPVWLWHASWWVAEQVFGWFCMLLGLAVVATIPLLQLVSLGYLLECSGRVANSGRLRDGFIDLDKWARIGALFAGSWLMLVPLRLFSQLAADAEFTSPGSSVAGGMQLALLGLTVLTVAHVLLAWYSGGKLRHFFWPLLAPFSLLQWLITRKVVGPIVRPLVRAVWPALAEDLYQPAPLATWFPPAMLLAGLWRGPANMYVSARDAVWDFVASLNLPHYFWLGLRGAAGALLWLAVPTVMVIASTKLKNDGLAFLITVAGVFALATVIMYLPFLQTHFAAENRFRAMFELSAIRRLFRKAPIGFWFTLLFTLALALPLYLFKVQKVYAEFYWLFSLFFIVFMYPGRLLAGWAVGLAKHRELPRFFLFRWGSGLAAFPICLLYASFVYLSQYTSWYGSWSLFEHHPFLVPVPFLGG